MRLTLRARNKDEADCLMQELAVYTPERRQRAVVLELQDASHNDLLGVLNVAERCLAENDIPSVKVEIDGKRYLMTAPARSRP